MEKAMAKLLILTLGILISYSLAFAQPISEQISLRDTSPNKVYCVFRAHRFYDEHQFEYKYMLITNCGNANSDTINFAYAIVADYSPPVFFWEKSSSKIIYEDGVKHFPDRRKIKIFDLKERKVVFETVGFINIPEEKKKSHFDPENNILIYYTSDKINEIDIMKLDVTGFKVTKLKTVSVIGDLDVIGIQSMDKTKMEISLQYTNPEFKGESITLHY